jgi:hypothetical protein
LLSKAFHLATVESLRFEPNALGQRYRHRLPSIHRFLKFNLQAGKDCIAFVGLETDIIKAARIFLDDVQACAKLNTTPPSSIPHIVSGAAELQIAITHKFRFGLVDDAEFMMKRDLFDVESGNSDRTIAYWKARRDFMSLWHAH